MIKDRPTLLILSHNRRNLELLTQVLEQASYQIIATSKYSELERALANPAGIDLGLIDLAGYVAKPCHQDYRQVWVYCERLQAENIPFLTFTPHYNRMIERDSLVHGASSVLVKPLVIQNLLLLIDSLVNNSE